MRGDDAAPVLSRRNLPMRLFADDALLPAGWARDVLLEIGKDGHFLEIQTSASPQGAERVAGPVVPAMPNVHSHAFQRALAGRTGDPSPHRDDTFWTWRQAMYAFLDRLDADAIEAIAAQAYVEMLKGGYASVGEFHYVHRDPAGAPFADDAELAWRIVSAAESAGIALTLLPVFYAHDSFGGTAASAGQRRFLHSVDTFVRLFETLAARASRHRYVLGVAPHSLRAVTPDELGVVIALASPSMPIHIHAAEQIREVEACVAWSGMRPVEWLLAHAPVDERWCLVHATHMLDHEIDRLTAARAVVGLASTTEADLGDGIFPGERFLECAGRFGVGSDSNTRVDPFSELKQLEWSQRLKLRRRNVLIGDAGSTVGTSLWSKAAKGGAQAIGRDCGRIAAGARADLVVLDREDPALLEQPAHSVLDAAIFGPSRKPVRDVMVGGHFVLRDGHHPREDEILARYRTTLARMTAA